MEGFNPFTDRHARLLRNGMAGSLVAALRAGGPGPFRQKGRALLARKAEPVHRAYLKDRLRRYECAFAEIEGRDVAGLFAQALVLWNHGLFYEVHELLEPLWLQSTGPRRRALQAMIRAAGAYVHLEAGNREAARGMAAKAAAGLAADGSALLPFAGREQLVAALVSLDQAPPRLGPAGVQTD
jgi:predicted metal-dependent hydrolase